MTKTKQAGLAIRAGLDEGRFDGCTTAEIAKAVGCSTAIALVALHNLEEQGFKRKGGGTLCHGENDAGMHTGSRGRGPVRYHWFCT